MQNIFNNKIIKLITAGFMLLFLAGCSQIQDKTVIKFSSWGSESEIRILKPLLKEFETQNPDIKVEFIHIPNNYFQKLHLLVASKLTPDVVFINNINGPVYAEHNIFEDLYSYLKTDSNIDENDFFANSLQAFKYKGTLYAIPRDVSNLVVYYNKDIFDKYKIPYPSKNWTFDDFKTTASLLTKDFNNDGRIDLFGTGFEEMPLFWTPFLWSNGGGIISSDLTKVEINKPESIEALQFYSDLRNKYHIAPTASEQGSSTTAQLFMQEKIAMQISGRWSVPRLRQDAEFNWDIAKFPKGKYGSVVDADTSGWAISKDSKHKQEAWKLISFLASKKSIQEFTKSGLIVPSRKDVANSEVFLNTNQMPHNARLFVDIIPESKPTPANDNYQEILDIVNTHLEPLWNGTKSAKQVITKDLVDQIQNLLK